MSCASMDKCTEDNRTRSVWGGRFSECGDGSYADVEGGEVFGLHAVFEGFGVGEEFYSADVGGDGREDGWDFP